MNQLRLPKTKAALDRYDEVDKFYSAKMWDVNIRNSVCLAYMAIIENERLVVCTTFYEETKERTHNSLSACKCIQMNDPWLRNVVEAYK